MRSAYRTGSNFQSHDLRVSGVCHDIVKCVNEEQVSRHCGHKLKETISHYNKIATKVKSITNDLHEPFPLTPTLSLYVKKLDFDIIWPELLTNKQDLDEFHAYSTKSFDQ